MSSQIETDSLIKRIKVLVTKHGGQSNKLAEIRAHYKFWHRCPADSMGYILVKEAVDKVEKEE